MSNFCRLCHKEIGKVFTDKILFCKRCRKEVEKAIGYEENKELKNLECEFGFECAENDYRRKECRRLKKENKDLMRYKKRYEELFGDDGELIYEDGLY